MRKAIAMAVAIVVVVAVAVSMRATCYGEQRDQGASVVGALTACG